MERDPRRLLQSADYWIISLCLKSESSRTIVALVAILEDPDFNQVLSADEARLEDLHVRT